MSRRRIKAAKRQESSPRLSKKGMLLGLFLAKKLPDDIVASLAGCTVADLEREVSQLSADERKILAYAFDYGLEHWLRTQDAAERN